MNEETTRHSGDSSFRIFRDDAKSLAEAEWTLLRTEAATVFKRNLLFAIAPGAGFALIVLSALAYTAFAILALGDALGGRYALSAFIVGSLGAIGGALTAYVGYARLRHAISFPQSRAAGRRLWDLTRTEFARFMTIIRGRSDVFG